MEAIINEINKLDLESRIKLVMSIWDNISEENIEPPDNHKKILDERLEKLHNKKMEFDSWENVQNRLVQ